MNDIRNVMLNVLFEDRVSDINQFLKLNFPVIKEYVRDFDVSKNVIFDPKKKLYKIIVPRNLREKFSELLKKYFDSNGVESKPQMSSDGQSIIGYFSKDLRVLFKPSANKGDVSEGLLGAAITARFINPTVDAITDVHIDSVLDAMRALYDGNIKVVENTWTIKNAKPDEVQFKLAMPKTSLNALLINRNEVKPLYKSVIAYINSKDKVSLIRDICKSKDGIYNNDQVDHVIISSMGTENQKNTKVDVSVKIKRGDGKTVQLKNLGNISLKALGTKQLYQYGGDKAENISEFFGNIFGISLPDDIQNKYNQTKQTGDKINSIKNVFQYVYDRIVSKLSGEVTAEEFVMNLANGIRNGALKAKGDNSDDKIILVHLGRDDFHELDFNLVHEKLKGHTISAELTTEGANPKIKVFAKKGNAEPKLLISIRARRDGKGIRILLEREKYLDEIITLSKSDITPIDVGSQDIKPNEEIKNVIKNGLFA